MQDRIIGNLVHGAISVPAVCLLYRDLCPETGPFVCFQTANKLFSAHTLRNCFKFCVMA